MSSSYVIFGAYGGIGSALCRRLVRKGAKLVLAGRDEVRLAGLAAELGADTVCLDACNLRQVETCLKQAVDLHGPLHGVANCVGSLLLKPAHLLSEAEWDGTVTANLKSAFAVVRGAAIAMAQTGGSVVLLSSAAARVGLANHEAISAAKAGIEGVALAASASYAAEGIRFNCIAPGMTRTPLTARLLQNEMVAKASAGMHALGRIGEPDDVASAIEWLLDPEQSWVTGQVIGVDGGLSRVRSRS
ncbi:MAG: SDR family oxidoreductase [Terriglobales bacterium]|jgi:NAD(P)-dependent dehydrogenase (short-subunit alcohol dehydrogenase family)